MSSQKINTEITPSWNPSRITHVDSLGNKIHEESKKGKLKKNPKVIKVLGVLKKDTFKNHPLLICKDNLQKMVKELDVDPHLESMFLGKSFKTPPKQDPKCYITGKHFYNSSINIITNIQKIEGSIGNSWNHYVITKDITTYNFARFLPLFAQSDSSIYILPDVLLDNSDVIDFEENTGSGIFIIKGLITSTKLEYKDYNKFSKPEFDNKSTLEDYYKKGSKSPTHKTTYGLKYTFGVEIECSKSFVPSYMTSSFNMDCVRDGSLNEQQGGPEYVTGVLVGDAGVMHLQQIINYLSPRSTIDKYCGIHVHVGGFVPSKEFSLAIFILCYELQDELFAMLPVSRRTNEYCRKIPKKPIQKLYSILHDSELPSQKARINEAYDYLVEYVGALDLFGGKEKYITQNSQRNGDNSNILGKILNKNSKHPFGRKCNYNHSTPRYEWLNLVPLLFNEKGPDVFTVEFRPHQASLNFLKIKNWLNICMCITSFAENHTSRILRNKKGQNILLEDVINTIVKDKMSSKYLLNYIQERTTKFLNTSKISATASIIEEESEYLEGSLIDVEDKTLKELCV